MRFTTSTFVRCGHVYDRGLRVTLGGLSMCILLLTLLVFLPSVSIERTLLLETQGFELGSIGKSLAILVRNAHRPIAADPPHSPSARHINLTSFF